MLPRSWISSRKDLCVSRGRDSRGAGQCSIIVLLTAALLVPASACSGAAAPRLRTSATKTTISLGDTITYRVRVVAAESVKVTIPYPIAKLGDFEVLGSRTFPPRPLGDGTASFGRDYVLSVYTIGEHRIPPPRVTVEAADGDILRPPGDTTRVIVQSVLGDGEGALRDIKGLATSLPGALWPRLVLGGAVLVAAALIAASMIRRRRAPVGVPAAPMRPPHVEALEGLEDLLQAGLIERDRLKEFYTRLSDVLRIYLSRRYLIPAPEMTTAELAGRMEYLGLPEALRRGTFDILAESDMVKFARYKPRMERAFEAALEAKGLVRESGCVGRDRGEPGREDPGGAGRDGPPGAAAEVSAGAQSKEPDR